MPDLAPGCPHTRRAAAVCPALLALLLSLLVPLRGAAQVAKLPPSDEAVRKPGLFSFRAQLQADVARHDTAALLAVVAPEIKIGFGGNDGIEAFKRQWRVGQADSELWGELGSLLALGGTFLDEDTFVAPYVFSRWPETIDAFEHVAVVATGVRVRAAPALDAPVLATLSFDIVKLSQAGRGRLTAEQTRQWTAVELRGGRTGYVASRYVRSPVGYRAFLVRQDGRWRLTTLVAGD